jgi:hypothetical protein
VRNILLPSLIHNTDARPTNFEQHGLDGDDPEIDMDWEPTGEEKDDTGSSSVTATGRTKALGEKGEAEAGAETRQKRRRGRCGD